MPERGREDKMGGGRCCEKKIERGIPESGKENKMRGGGLMQKKNDGINVCRRGVKTKCGGGGGLKS